MKKIKIGITALLLTLVFASPSSFASNKCFKSPDGDKTQLNLPGGLDQYAMRDNLMKNTPSDPAQELLACFLQTDAENPTGIVSKYCGCLEAIKKMCKFKLKKGKWKISAKSPAQKAWCVPFLFTAF